MIKKIYNSRSISELLYGKDGSKKDYNMTIFRKAAKKKKERKEKKKTYFKGHSKAKWSKIASFDPEVQTIYLSIYLSISIYIYILRVCMSKTIVSLPICHQGHSCTGGPLTLWRLNDALSLKETSLPKINRFIDSEDDSKFHLIQ